MDPRIVLFYRQYLQQLGELSFPPSDVLIQLPVQLQIFKSMFDSSRASTLPPTNYQRRALKTLAEKIESAIRDPDEDEISDDLVSHMAFLSTVKSQSDLEVATQKSIVSYHLPSEVTIASSPILIQESRNLLASSGTTGLRTWDACLHLASFLATEARSWINQKAVVELGAGTGLLSILCAGPLQARSVLATDGDAEVVTVIEQNALLNEEHFNRPGSAKCLHAKVLDWRDPPSLKDMLKQTTRELVIDYVVGADITYSIDSFEPLVATLDTIQDHSPQAVILISATVRNQETFLAFINTCRTRRFRVTDIPYNCPPLELQTGFFHKTSAPMRIVRVTRDKR